MKTLILLIATVIVAIPSMTDFKCMNECTAKGYMYGYCQRVCSY